MNSTGADPAGRRPIEAFRDAYYQAGWYRHLPNSAIAILGPLADGPTTVREFALAPTPEAPDLGWDSTAWEPLHTYTDEELRELDAHFEETPFAIGPDQPSDAAAVMAQESQARAKHIDEMDRYSAALGVAPVRNLSQVLDFLVACGVVLRTGAGDDVVLELNSAAPLPGEVLPLSEAERRRREALEVSA